MNSRRSYGWSRNVRHYIEEGPQSPLALLELGRSSSSAIDLILRTLDRFYGEAPPPPRVTRELVDHPTCTPEGYTLSSARISTAGSMRWRPIAGGSGPCPS